MLLFLTAFVAFACSVATGQQYAMSPSLTYMRGFHDAAKLLKIQYSKSGTADNLIRFNLADAWSRAAANSLPSSSNDPSQCIKDMFAVVKAASEPGETWAKQYMDSWATKPSGTMLGNTRWFGDFDECLSIGQVTAQTGPFSKSTFTSQYCRIGVAGINQTVAVPAPALYQVYPTLMLGFCVSSNCKPEYFADIVNPIIANMSLRVVDGLSYCQLQDPPFTGYAITAIAIFSLIGCFIAFGLGWDLYKIISTWFRARRSQQNPENGELIVGEVKPQGANKPTDVNSTETQHQPSPKASSAAWKLAETIFLSFSPLSNLTKVVKLPNSATPAKTPNLSCINGIRTLSLFWVILGHTHVIIFQSADNIAAAYGLLTKLGFQFVFNGHFAVDSFFFLSGFLAYWSLSKQFMRDGFKFWRSLPVLYLHRFIRLTPPYAALILIDLGLWAFLANGPFYYQGIDEACVKNGWSNILYINNFIDTNYPCVGWSWYLAIDMQLFLAVPFVVYLFVKSSGKINYGWVACLGLILAQAILAFSLTMAYTLPTSGIPPMVTPANVTVPVKAYADYNFIMYVSPFCRMGAYFVGVAIARIAASHSRFLVKTIFSNLCLVTLDWLLSITILVTLCYSTYGVYSGQRVDPTIADAFYNALARIAWALALGWITLSCVFNRAGVVGDILSWPAWALSARLSYSAYLLHPLILVFYVQTSRRPFHVTDIDIAFEYCSVVVMTFLASTLFTLAFESPVVGLQRLIKGGGSAE